MKVLVTGGCGFIGSNFIVGLLKVEGVERIINIDALTYAANPKFLEGKVDSRYEHAKFNLQKDTLCIEALIESYRPDYIFHFAAESHVCNSIKGPGVFYDTNVIGTVNLLEAIRKSGHKCRLVHISTDEVFGELPIEGGEKFDEFYPILPNSPYAASKAASDLAVRAWWRTYGVDGVIVNCSNNFGPNQHAEKFIPRIIRAIADNKPITIYGTGQQIRDWLFVEDCCDGILMAGIHGQAGERYCLGGERPMKNVDMIDYVISCCSALSGKSLNPQVLLTNDRPTDDQKYEIDSTKAGFDLGWTPNNCDFEVNLAKTVSWYLKEWGITL